MDFIKKNMFAVIAACCAVLAVVLWLFTWQWEVKSMGITTHAKGLACAFGGKGVAEGGGYTLKADFADASVGGIITLVLIVAGIASAVVAMLKNDLSFMCGVVAGVCLVVAGILLFCGTTDLMVNPKNGNMSDLEHVKLGIGCVLAAIAAIGGGAAALCGSLLPKLKK